MTDDIVLSILFDSDYGDGITAESHWMKEVKADTTIGELREEILKKVKNQSPIGIGCRHVDISQILIFGEKIALARWFDVNERLPKVDASGESEYVMACNAETRCIPKIVKYSNGEWSKRGWYTTTIGDHIPFHRGRGKDRRLTFTHWMKIELPK